MEFVKHKKLNKKGFTIGAVPQLVIMLLVIAIILGIGLTILNSMQDSSNCDYNFANNGYCYSCESTTSSTWDTANQTCYNSTGAETTPIPEQSLAFNVTNEGEGALDDLSNWQSTWAIIIAASVVIGIISSYLMFRKKR